ILGSVPITNDRRTKQLISFGMVPMPLITDGPRVYFAELPGGNQSVVAAVSAAGGEAIPVSTPFQNAAPLDISTDRSELLLSSWVGFHLFLRQQRPRNRGVLKLRIRFGSCLCSADHRAVSATCSLTMQPVSEREAANLCQQTRTIRG